MNIYTPQKNWKITSGKNNGAIIRCKCDWYEHVEKSSKFSYNLEKKHAIQNQIRTVSGNETGITNEHEIINKLFKYYKALFPKKSMSQKS